MPASEQGVSKSQDRYHLVPRVLCFVTTASGDEVLLLKGAPDKRIWPGKYNGLGGHVERGESVHAAARREIREEAGVEVEDLRLRGVITIETGEPAGIGLFVFTATALGRAIRPSTEGTLEWVPSHRIAELDAVEDLPVLLPHVLSMKDGDPPFSARYTYDTNDKLVIEFFDDTNSNSKL
jgi:8-oxo-dGTP diphosphatase